MSTCKANNFQIGQSVTATNNGTWYQPATPDGTIRYGIGNAGATTSDVVTLSSSGLSATALIPSGSTAPTNGMFLPTTNTLAWSTNSTERLRLDSSGNLGLGVTPSAFYGTLKALQVGALGATVITGNTSAGGTSVFGQNLYADINTAVQRYAASSYASSYNQYQGTHQWFTAPSGTAGNAISFTQAMTLDASGNLTIGATSGAARISTVAASGQYAGYFTFPSSGYGIGVANSSGGSGALMYFFSTSYVGGITTNGTTTTYASASDQRLKTNIAPSDSALQSILDFPVDQFDWISSGEHQDFGAVAQKAINVIPEMVSVPEDPDEMWGIDWSKAVPRLIKTIQEMHEEIQTLKQKVNA